MKFMNTARRFGSHAVAVVTVATASALSQAEGGIAAAAVAELGSAKTDANTVGLAIIGIVAAVAVIGIIIAMVRRGGK